MIVVFSHRSHCALVAFSKKSQKNSKKGLTNEYLCGIIASSKIFWRKSIMKKIFSILLAVALLACSVATLASCKKDDKAANQVKVIDIALTEEQYAFAIKK